MTRTEANEILKNLKCIEANLAAVFTNSPAEARIMSHLVAIGKVVKPYAVKFGADAMSPEKAVTILKDILKHHSYPVEIYCDGEGDDLLEAIRVLVVAFEEGAP